MRILAILGAGTMAAACASAQVELTQVSRGASLHLESLSDGPADVSEGSSAFGDYVHATEQGLGDPLAAWGAASFDTTITADGETIAGTIVSESLSVTTDTNSGYNYTDAGFTIWFTLHSAADISIAREMSLDDAGGGFAYQDLQLWDVTNDSEVLRDDWWQNGEASDLDTLTLPSGDYWLRLSASAEGEYPPPPLGDNGDRTARSELTFDVSFVVPAPGATIACLGACWWVRRRR